MPATRPGLPRFAVIWLGALCLLGQSQVADAQIFGPLGPPTSHRSTEVKEKIPHWLELPRTARIRTGEGVDVVPLYNSAVTLENLRVGVLVGAFRNTGGCTTDIRARLQYVDATWQPVGPLIENEARVSRVEPDGILPYRFRLHTIDDMDIPPSGYVILIDQLDKPLVNPTRWNRWVSASRPAPDTRPCTPGPTRVETAVTGRLPMRDGFRLEGMATLVTGGPVRSDGVVLTVVLQDKDQQVLEVLVGTPTFRRKDFPDGLLHHGQTVPFALRTDMPVGRTPAHVTVMVELLPDAELLPDTTPPPVPPRE